MLPVGLDQVGESPKALGIDAEGILEPRSPEVGGDDDHPAAGEGPGHGQVGRDEGLPVAGFWAGDHEDRALLVDQEDPEAGAKVTDGFGQRGHGSLHECQSHLTLLDLGVLRKFA